MPVSIRTLFLASLAVFMAQGIPDQVRADYFEWETWQDNASSKNGQAVQLVLHVPETDNIRFQATCRPDRLSAHLGYNTGRRTENMPVSLNITSSRYNASMNGNVRGTKQEEGLVGVQLLLRIDDPFWANLEELSAFSYAIGTEPSARLDLTGSGPAVRKFIDQCKTLLASAPPTPKPTSAPAVPKPAGTATGSLTCKGWEAQKSRESRIPVTVTFINQSEGYRGLVWINFKGQPVDFANLDKGKTYTVKTYLTHVWMFTDGPGNCIEMFTPQPGMTRFRITAPSPAFGPEND